MHADHIVPISAEQQRWTVKLETGKAKALKVGKVVFVAAKDTDLAKKVNDDYNIAKEARQLESSLAQQR